MTIFFVEHIPQVKHCQFQNLQALNGREEGARLEIVKQNLADNLTANLGYFSFFLFPCRFQLVKLNVTRTDEVHLGLSP